MKMIFVLAASLFCTISSKAQDRWTVQLNSTTLLTANEEDTAKNIVKADDLKKRIADCNLPSGQSGKRTQTPDNDF